MSGGGQDLLIVPIHLVILVMIMSVMFNLQSKDAMFLTSLLYQGYHWAVTVLKTCQLFQ